MNPSAVKNYVLFATFAFNHGSFQVGIDMIDAGLKVLPGAAPLYLSRGVLRVQLSQIDGALDDFEQAHRLDPNLSFAEDAMGMIHSQQHDNQGSLEAFRRHAKKIRAILFCSISMRRHCWRAPTPASLKCKQKLSAPRAKRWSWNLTISRHEICSRFYICAREMLRLRNNRPRKPSSEIPMTAPLFIKR